MKLLGMTIRLGLAIVGALALLGEAMAAVMGLGGPSPDQPGAIVSEATDVLYATDRRGHEVELARVGMWHGLDVRDLGLPFIGDDGTVVFAAEVVQDRQLRWRLFIASPDRENVKAVELPKPLEMRADPRPFAGIDGALLFSVTDPVEALYKLKPNGLECLVKAGQRLPDGHIVDALSLGSVSSMDGNTIALIVYLRPGRQSELLISRHRVSILATENDRAPDGSRYLHLGRPAIGLRNDEPTVAFTARTTHGYNLYDFGRGTLRRILSGGAPCSHGVITFLSDEKADFEGGNIAVEGACSGDPKRLVVMPDRYVDTDSLSLDRLLVTPGATAIETSHSIESTTLSVNRNGEAAYLGGPRHSAMQQPEIKIEDHLGLHE